MTAAGEGEVASAYGGQAPANGQADRRGSQGKVRASPGPTTLSLSARAANLRQAAKAKAQAHARSRTRPEPEPSSTSTSTSTSDCRHVWCLVASRHTARQTPAPGARPARPARQPANRLCPAPSSRLTTQPTPSTTATALPRLPTLPPAWSHRQQHTTTSRSLARGLHPSPHRHNHLLPHPSSSVSILASPSSAPTSPARRAPSLSPPPVPFPQGTPHQPPKHLKGPARDTSQHPRLPPLPLDTPSPHVRL